MATAGSRTTACGRTRHMQTSEPTATVCRVADGRASAVATAYAVQRNPG